MLLFISFFRGTPLLVQLFLFCFGLRQAAGVAAPTLVNCFIDMIKGTYPTFTLGVTETMSAARKEAVGSFLYCEGFLAVAVICWIMVEGLSQAQKAIEIRLKKAYAR